jgi:uncharacterized protein (UPF0332 family)
MRGEDFIDLAMGLSEAGSEAAHRTAVSRAYYGVFHVALQLLADAGIGLPDTAEAHRKVLFCLTNSGDDLGRKVGTRLELLRRQRNVADYNLRDVTFQQRTPADKAILLAQHLVTLLASFRDEPSWSRFRVAVRSYAAQVLRLPVS